MTLYKINFAWENDYEDHEISETVFTFADSYSEAIQKIETEYQYINSICIESIAFEVTSDIFYLPHKDIITLQDFIDENTY